MLDEQKKSTTKLTAYQMVLQLARKYKAESLCQTAEELYKQAIVHARALPPSQSTVLIESLYELANYYAFQGKEEKAQPLWDEIKEHASECFQPQDYIYVQTIYSLAQLYEKQEKSEQSESLYKELLQKQEAAFGDESLEICPTLDQLAAFYCHIKKYTLAESLYLRILVIKEFHLGTCSVEINYTVNSLIDIFQKLGKWRLAEYMLNRQKAILVALHGRESLCVASCALRLAELQATHGNQFDKVIENLALTVRIYENKFGDQAGPVILLRKKLDQMLLFRLENQASAMPHDNVVTAELSAKESKQQNRAPQLGATQNSLVAV